MSDTKLFRQAFKDAGFRQAYSYAPSVFNDKHKDGTTRRLKLWAGDHVFSAPQFAQEELERQLKLKFGDRYLFGQFVKRHSWWTTDTSKSFCVYLLTA
jgi:hypothetical protein